MPVYISVKSGLPACKYFTMGREVVEDCRECFKDMSASRSIFGCLQRHTGHKRGTFSKGSARVCICPRSRILPICLPSCYVLYIFLFYIFLFLEINLSFTSLMLNFSALFNHVPSTCLGCSTLHLRDKLLAKQMGREVQILS